MTIRKFVFWCHLIAGCVAGIVILGMCATGVLLAYERQIVHRAERGFAVVPAPGSRHLPLETLLNAARGSSTDTPVSITWRSDPGEPAEVSFGRTKSLLLNPYSGAVLGQGAVHTRSFFRVTEDIHRWLAFGPEHRTLGRAVTGACNLAFLFLVCSGPYLWLPRIWSRATLRAGMRFNGKLTGKARDFNWHNVIGFWCFLPLAVIVLCAVVMSYPWANNLVYRVTGNQPPLQSPAQAAASAAGTGKRNGSAPLSSSWEGLEILGGQAEQRVAGWRTIALRLPGPSDPSITFSIDSGTGGRPDKRAQLTLNRKTGAEVRYEPFSSYNSGRRLRAWIRFSHTGEAGGFFGQSVAALATLGGAFLVWTGLSLALRRLQARLTR